MFGLGEGLNFIFLNISSLNLPFIGGRSKPFELTKALCRNLDLSLEEKETNSKAKAWNNLFDVLWMGRPVGLQLDSFHLDYFSSKIHFAGHAVVCIGASENYVTVIDTAQQGGIHQVLLSDLEKARFEKGPMSAKARSWTIKASAKDYDLKTSIKTAVHHNAQAYLKPAFKGMSYLGIEKFSLSVPKWLEIAKTPGDLILASLLMEKAGTGGGIFRCFYRDFLKESSQLLDIKILHDAYHAFTQIAMDWQNVAQLIKEAGQNENTKPLNEASKLCRSLARSEKMTMEMLGGLKV